MKVISLIGDAVLTLTVPDEEMISIDTTEITITLGRHSTDKLAGLNIQGRDGRFVLPADKKALVSRIQEASFVDTQVDKSVFLSKMRRYEYLCYFLYDFHERVRASTNMRGVDNPPFFSINIKLQPKCRAIHENYVVRFADVINPIQSLHLGQY